MFSCYLTSIVCIAIIPRKKVQKKEVNPPSNISTNQQQKKTKNSKTIQSKKTSKQIQNPCIKLMEVKASTAAKKISNTTKNKTKTKTKNETKTKNGNNKTKPKIIDNNSLHKLDPIPSCMLFFRYVPFYCY